MSTKSSGKTAEKHADAILEIMYPGFPVQRAVQSVRWMFADGKRFPRSFAEDLYGCLDRLVLHGNGVLGVQVTTLGGTRDTTGTATMRRAKVKKLLAEPMLDAMDETMVPEYLELEVWAWERRQCIHRWYWSWGKREWIRAGQLWSPLLAKAKSL